MANKAVFLDRDHTLIEDPGYLSDPHAVKLLPGVELALKSLAAGGFKTIVATNQSAVARGLVTEETLDRIHSELRRLLEEKGARLDGIYYCPYHPEGTVEGYAIDSELRKPKPGMLLQAAEEMDIDLKNSWMVGDNACDVEAGQRAGCRTIRLRSGAPTPPGDVAQEDVQADFTARNLVEAARIILRETGYSGPPSSAALPETPTTSEEAIAPPPAAGERTAPTAPPPASSQEQVCREILRYVKHIAHARDEDFSVMKVLAGIVQMMALLALVLTLWRVATDQLAQASLWAQIAIVLQVMALTFFMMRK